MNHTQMHLGMYAEYEQLAQDFRAVQGELAELRESAESDDGLVVATVGGGGELVELWLDPRIYRTADSAALAETITEVIRRAAEQVQRRSLAVTARFLPADAEIDSTDLRFDPVLRELDRARER